MTRWLILGALAIVFGAAAPIGNAEQGQRIVRHGSNTGVLPCMACHGPALGGNPSIGAPAIAGMAPTATLAALNAIAAGRTGRNYVMRNIARALTAAQRRNVAAYLATLKDRP